MIGGLTTCFGILSGSRNLRVARGQKECLSQGPLSDTQKETQCLFGVHGNLVKLLDKHRITAQMPKSNQRTVVSFAVVRGSTTLM